METVAYKLEEPSEDQLVAVITSHVKNPKEAHKAATNDADKILKTLNDN